jgi:DNA-directed RNA polymerase subunit beta'
LKSFNLPVGAHIMVDDDSKCETGQILVKIPRMAGKTGDITGGLPRVTELFEARNPSNPTIVSEIDGIVSFGNIKRGNREIAIESKTGEIKRYLVPLSKHILVQENDFVRAGQPLSDGAISPGDILDIQGPTAVQEYLVNEIQEVYRLQGVKINDKHFEVIVRQMMRKVEILDSGDTLFLERSVVNKAEFILENDALWGKMIVIDAGDSEQLKPGQMISARKLRDENSQLKRKDKKQVVAREAIAATARPVLQGITKASLQTDSFISAASFQETTKVLNEAAVSGKRDYLNGLKENVIVGHLIPAGTGMREFHKNIVYHVDEHAKLVDARQSVEME